ncbi:hypothetical protein BT96DRAFT_937956 [Gymnopus androsaceus JB14]|uniref:Uncharacterized protein n=1 Tax=Gymnopus androsaceus JB14 TaxID=1447944 RepID=A0A6A4HXX5_9AGAR|nr:hypothetical protein BT96DRAFT_937956 [Gymnopus androsaceus JB14]
MIGMFPKVKGSYQIDMSIDQKLVASVKHQHSYIEMLIDQWQVIGNWQQVSEMSSDDSMDITVRENILELCLKLANLLKPKALAMMNLGEKHKSAGSSKAPKNKPEVIDATLLGYYPLNIQELILVAQSHLQLYMALYNPFLDLYSDAEVFYDCLQKILRLSQEHCSTIKHYLYKSQKSFRSSLKKEVLFQVKTAYELPLPTSREPYMTGHNSQQYENLVKVYNQDLLHKESFLLNSFNDKMDHCISLYQNSTSPIKKDFDATNDCASYTAFTAGLVSMKKVTNYPRSGTYENKMLILNILAQSHDMASLV